MNQKNKAIIAMALLGFLAMGCTKKQQPSDGSVDEGIAAANSWLEVVDAQRHDDSWEQACAYFKGVVPRDQWVQQIAGVRGPLGPVLSREVVSAEHTTKLPGAPDGEYVVIQYRTKFQNKATAIETVTPMRDPDGVYRVSGYYVR